MSPARPSRRLLTSLQREGLEPVVSLTANARVASGLVVGTTPPGGTVVKKGSRVGVVVSSGPGIVALPNVNNKKSAEAMKILREKGFQPTTQSQSSDTVAKGLVISTDPAAGIEVQVGSSGHGARVLRAPGSERAGSDGRIAGRRDRDTRGRWAEGDRVQARSRRTVARYGHLPVAERGLAAEGGQTGDDRRGASAQAGAGALGGRPERSAGGRDAHRAPASPRTP